MGRALECADMTTRILDVRSSSLVPDDATAGLAPFESAQWRSVLKSLTAYQMYRQKMHARIGRHNVLVFLLQDDEFPRAVSRCLDLLESGLSRLPHNDAPRRSLAVVQRMISRADIHTLAVDKAALHEFLDQVQERLAVVHDDITSTWFLAGMSAESVEATM